METVLITGGAGYIGSHVQYAFLDKGYHVVIIDDLSKGKKHALSPDSKFYEGKIQDKDLLAKIFTQNEIKGVLHFAASTEVPESMRNPLKYYENNTEASRILIEACVAHQIKNSIFSSTAAVYGTPSEQSVSEEASTQPISPYGQSKLMTELMIKDVTKAHDFNHCILRYFNVAGADPQMRTLTGKRKAIEIFGQDYPTKDGTSIRDFIHVSDLADAHLLAFEHLKAHKQSMTLNCGYNQGYSVNEAIQCAEKIANQKIKMISAKRREGDIMALTAKSDRIRNILNWSPQHANLQQIISSAYEWEKRHR